MKKKILSFLITILAVCTLMFTMTACTSKVEFKINFVVGSEVYAVVNTNGEEIIKMPQDPSKEDYNFDGWFWDKDVWEKPFTANSLLDAPLSSNMSVYAKFSLIHVCAFTEEVANNEYIATNATCEERATYYYSCTCGEMGTETFESGEPLGHSFTNYVFNNDATCLEDGTETAVCDNGCGKDDTRIKVGSALNHDFSIPTYEWKGNVCTATRVCGRDNNHVESETVVATYVKDTDATCTTIEKGHYKAEFQNTAFATQTTAKDSVVNGGVLGHSYSTPTYTWEEDKCTATMVCGRDNQHVESETVVATYVKDTDKTCTTAEKGHYRAEFVNSAFTTQTTAKDSVVNGGVLGHSYSTPTYTWEEDKCTAIRICDRDNSHVESETVTETYVKDTDATCTTAETGHYKAEFVNTAFAIQTTAKDSVTNGNSKGHAYTIGTSNNDGTHVLVCANDQNHKQTKICEYNYISNNDGTKTGTCECKHSILAVDETVLTVSNNVITGVTEYGKTLSKIIIIDGITSIGNYAFSGCSSLTSITIPNSITSIGSSAFSGCSKLTSVEIPNSVTSIGSSAFNGCRSLESITLPFVGAKAGVTSSDKYQYPFGYIFGTSNYTGSYSATQYYYGSSTYGTTNSTYYIPTSLKSVTITGGNILYGAFSDCTSLTSVVIGDSVTSIGNYAFEDCTALTSVVIGDSVTSIGNYAFSDCTSLTSVVIGDSVTSIGSEAFYGCSLLTSIIIPDSVTSIGSGAFAGCGSLESITLPFVGSRAGVTSSDKYQLPFGYIFGEKSYTGSYSATQYYYGYSTSSTTNSTYYIPTSLKSVTITGGNILYCAFYNCSSLTSVVIGDSVTSIGSGAFYNCSKLTNVNYTGTIDQWVQIEFGDSTSNPLEYAKNLYINGELVTQANITTATKINAYALSSCDSLTSVAIGDSVTSIGERAFAYCSSLTSVEIPNSVTSIGYEAFRDCTALTSVVIPNSVTSIGSYAFYNCTALTSVVIGNRVTSIGYAAFSGCSSLTSVVIGNSVTSIGEGAFSGCSSLTSIVIPNSVTSIGEDAFNGCPIENATIPTSAISHIPKSTLKTVIITGGTSIGYPAFSGCSSLTSVVMSNSVTSIGDYAFSNCDSLTSIVIPDSVTSIGDFAFRDCTALTSVVIGNSVTSIGSYAFEYCSSLTSVEIPNSVTSIGYEAFRDCTALTSVVIPNSVTSIGSYAFYNCTALTSVVIGNRVTSIGSYAFSGCSSLESITLPFVGATKDGTENTHFGYIFGASSYSNNDSYVPSSLKTVIITGGESIDYCAFYNCSSLTSIEIPNSVTSIGEYAFKYCYKLVEVINKSTYITIEKGSDSNGYVGYYALVVYNSDSGITESQLVYDNGYIICADGNEKILVGYNGQETDLTLPNYITKINSRAFYNCRSLTSVVIGDSVTSIGDWAFSSCSSLTSVVIGDSVTSIGYEAFCDCTALTSVVIPNSVTSIGSYAFYNCTALTSVVIGNRVTSIGYAAFSGCSSLTSVVIGNSVTSIGEGAFSGCSSLTSIVIPNSVTSIGYAAFSGCSSLTSITLPFVGAKAGVTSSDTYQYPFGYIFGRSEYTGSYSTEQYYYGSSTSSITYSTYYIPSSLKYVTITGGNILYGAFSGCSSLINVVIGDSVTSIGGSAFHGCTSLTSIEIPNSVTGIGSSAFYGCSSLESITLPFVGAKDSVTSSDTYQYPFGYIFGTSSYTGSYSAKQYYYGSSTSSTTSTTYYIPSSLKYVTITGGNILYGAFSNCTSLTNMTIGDDVKSINLNAFENCVIERVSLPSAFISRIPKDNLKEVVITSGTSIGDEAFYECASLESVVIPNSVTHIDNSAFAHCAKLTSITMSNSVTNIGDSVFYGCTSLESVVIPESVTSMGAYVFDDTKIYNDEANWKKGVLYVNNWVVSTRTDITGECYIKEETIGIASYAFVGCKYLESITIPDSVISIGYGAFSGCSSLEAIIIPDSVITIGSFAFYNCSSLSIVLIGSGVTSMDRYVFEGCDSLISLTFKDTSTWYRTTNWSNWNNKKSGTSTSVTNSSTNAKYFTSTYYDYYWYKK